MKTILTLLIVGSLCTSSQASTNAMLRGIRIVETQDQLHPPRGKLGERGPYQFRRSTWRMHTSSSFDLAENREVANTVARRHYAWIETQLKANGVEASPYNVAMAWNAGVNSVIRGRVPAVARDYASRVLNIAGTFADETPETGDSTTLVAENSAPTENEVPASATYMADDANAPDTATANIATNNIATTDAIPTEYVYTVPPGPSDPVQVRFHTSAIMLAFNRPGSSESPVRESEPVQMASATNTQIAGNFMQTSGQM